ncbi:MAG: hypothetical protein JXD21_08490 [Candidatus Omnitrophica bacterium]|nr:hypothetical protein [Candidatus Omnitrophota bacterium]
MKRIFLLSLVIIIVMGPCRKDTYQFSAYAEENLLAKAVNNAQWVDWEKITREEPAVVAEELKLLSLIQKKLDNFQPLNDEEALLLAELWGSRDERTVDKSAQLIHQVLKGIDQVHMEKSIGGEELSIILNYYSVIGGIILSLESRGDDSLCSAKKELIAAQGKKMVVPLVLYGFTSREETVRAASEEIMMMIDEDPVVIARTLCDFFTVEYNQTFRAETVQHIFNVFVALENKNSRENEIYQTLSAYATEALSEYCSLDTKRQHDERSLSRITRAIHALSSREDYLSF